MKQILTIGMCMYLCLYVCIYKYIQWLYLLFTRYSLDLSAGSADRKLQKNHKACEKGIDLTVCVVWLKHVGSSFMEVTYGG